MGLILKTYSASNRGKPAEKKLKTFLEDLSSKSDAAVHRLPDAHAGSMVATLCDFIFMKRGQLYLIECKSTLHNYRLPHGNVEADQVAKMRLWKYAGACAFVMVYHESIDLWRSEEIDFFLKKEGGSWDLRYQEPANIETALGRFVTDAYSS